MRFSTLLLAACALPLSLPASAQTVTVADNVYIANQGAFSANTSSITRSSIGAGFGAPDEMDLFRGQFGSTVQSATIVGDRLYVMSDEAGRIDVIDTGADTRVAQIASGDVNSARYFTQVSDTKAYVTQLYLPDGSFSGGSVAVVDLEANTFSEVINDDSFSNPEGIAVVDGRAFVANAGFGASTTLSVIDTATDTVTGVVELSCSARAVLPDEADGEVYAFCEEEVVVVTAATGEVAFRIAAPEAVRPLGTGGLGQDATALIPRDGAYAEPEFAAVGSGGVMLLNPNDDEVDTIEFEQEGAISALGYGLYFSQGTFDITLVRFLFVGRPDADNPFSADGTVTVYNRDDEEENVEFAAGIYPTHVSIRTVIATATGPVAESDAFAIQRVFPNPAAGRATAAFTLDRAATVQIAVIDVLGREVLADERTFGAGAQQVDLEAATLPAGLYVLRLVADGRAATARFTVAR